MIFFKIVLLAIFCLPILAAGNCTTEAELLRKSIISQSEHEVSVINFLDDTVDIVKDYGERSLWDRSPYIYEQSKIVARRGRNISKQMKQRSSVMKDDSLEKLNDIVRCTTRSVE